MTKAKRKIDFTEGPLFWRLLWFMIPIIAKPEEENTEEKQHAEAK